MDRSITSERRNIEENGAVPGIDKIARELDGDSSLQEVRRAIARLMLDQLYALQALPRRWEKIHFANAAAALAMNIHAIQQPTIVWLRLCLVDLRKAIASIQSSAPFAARDRYLDTMTLEELIAAVEELYAQA
jgi:hypothetical protein